MKRKTKIIVGVTLLVLAAGGGGWWGYRKYEERRVTAMLMEFLFTPMPPSWRDSLPATATDVHEWAWAEPFLPDDYSYRLKARLTEPEFQQLMTKLNLTPHTPDRKYSEESNWLSYSRDPRCKEDWWDASSSIDGSFVQQDRRTWTFAKYENGFLYFASLRH